MSEAQPLVAAVGRLVEALPDGALDALISALRRDVPRPALGSLVATPGYAAPVGSLVAAWASAPSVSSEALAFALDCARDRQRQAASSRVSIVWTGPATNEVPVRRTDQVLLQIITGAQDRLILTSFAVYKVPAIAAALLAAHHRGVRVTFVAEPRPKDGESQADAIRWMLGPDLLGAIEVLVWDESHRLRAANGDHGVVHAKCAVADGRHLLVSSANLTEYALSINMELGLLIAGGDAPVRVQAHLEALAASGVLQGASCRP